MDTLIKWIRKAGASVLFTGYFPVASGTVGSAIACAAIWYLNSRYPQYFLPQAALKFWFAIVAITALSVWFSTRAKENFGADDPSPIIIDEVAGQFITFFLMPITIPTLVTGFLLFRFFDIVKPYPVHLMEELEDGVGITMDDVMGGILANVSLHLIYWGYHAVRGLL